LVGPFCELQTTVKVVNYYRLIIETVKEAFVTGGTGFLGAHLISRLLQAGYQVDAIYRNPSKLTDFEAMARTYLLQPAQKEALRWHKADVRDSASLQELIHSEHQVFHAAGMVSFDEKKAHRMYETNVLGTAAMVDVCLYKGVKHFCHVSSTAAVGKTSSEHELILEDRRIESLHGEPGRYPRNRKLEFRNLPLVPTGAQRLESILPRIERFYRCGRCM
jgi:nucleoside-diphosphate-sugar epimerase